MVRAGAPAARVPAAVAPRARVAAAVPAAWLAGAAAEPRAGARAAAAEAAEPLAVEEDKLAAPRAWAPAARRRQGRVARWQPVQVAQRRARVVGVAKWRAANGPGDAPQDRLVARA